MPQASQPSQEELGFDGPGGPKGCLRSVSGEVISYPVSNAGLGHDEVAEGSRWIGCRQLPPELADMDVNVGILALVCLAPDGAQEPALRHEPTRVCQEHAKDLELTGSKVDALGSDKDLVPRGVQNERAGGQPTIARRPLARRRAGERREDGR